MAKPIQMWQQLGPRLASATPLEAEELIEAVTSATNQSRGSILAVLAELDAVIEKGLKAGRTVVLPNGLRYRPVGKSDGSIVVKVYLDRRLVRSINSEFRGKWVNAQHINLSEAEMIAIWNEQYPDNPIALNGTTNGPDELDL